MTKIRRGLLIGLFLVACTAAIGWISGKVDSGAFVSSELYQEEMSFENPQSEFQQRQQIFVPPEYGNLFAVTSGGRGAVLWFVQGGVIRNVRVGEDAVIVQRRGRLIK
ncbi:MAG: hypothetical protein HY922_12530 [Elusimicrobia bacterium]|nr:hypothetical protein [Elusimicrobiota bacterium]